MDVMFSRVSGRPNVAPFRWSQGGQTCSKTQLEANDTLFQNHSLSSTVRVRSARNRKQVVSKDLCGVVGCRLITLRSESRGSLFNDLRAIPRVFRRGGLRLGWLPENSTNRF